MHDFLEIYAKRRKYSNNKEVKQ